MRCLSSQAKAPAGLLVSNLPSAEMIFETTLQAFSSLTIKSSTHLGRGARYGQSSQKQ